MVGQMFQQAHVSRVVSKHDALCSRESAQVFVRYNKEVSAAWSQRQLAAACGAAQSNRV